MATTRPTFEASRSSPLAPTMTSTTGLAIWAPPVVADFAKEQRLNTQQELTLRATLD